MGVGGASQGTARFGFLAGMSETRLPSAASDVQNHTSTTTDELEGKADAIFSIASGIAVGLPVCNSD
jgi:hypothetical protein